MAHQPDLALLSVEDGVTRSEIKVSDTEKSWDIFPTHPRAKFVRPSGARLRTTIRRRATNPPNERLYDGNWELCKVQPTIGLNIINRKSDEAPRS